MRVRALWVCLLLGAGLLSYSLFERLALRSATSDGADFWALALSPTAGGYGGGCVTPKPVEGNYYMSTWGCTHSSIVRVPADEVEAALPTSIQGIPKPAPWQSELQSKYLSEGLSAEEVLAAREPTLRGHLFITNVRKQAFYPWSEVTLSEPAWNLEMTATALEHEAEVQQGIADSFEDRHHRIDLPIWLGLFVLLFGLAPPGKTRPLWGALRGLVFPAALLGALYALHWTPSGEEPFWAGSTDATIPPLLAFVEQARLSPAAELASEHWGKLLGLSLVSSLGFGLISWGWSRPRSELGSRRSVEAVLLALPGAALVVALGCTLISVFRVDLQELQDAGEHLLVPLPVAVGLSLWAALTVLCFVLRARIASSRAPEPQGSGSEAT